MPATRAPKQQSGHRPSAVARAAGLRERKKAQTRRTIQEQALRLFTANGYDRTTVQDIAAAAGVSHMTFFRYFPTKEDVVLSDDYDPMIAALIGSRPAENQPWPQFAWRSAPASPESLGNIVRHAARLARAC